MDLNLATLAAFSLACFLIELTPGPNMTYLAIVAMGQGRRAGYAVVAGVALGLLSIGLLASFGVAALIAESRVLYEILRWGGVGYMAFLAWEAWREAGETSPERAVSGRAHLFRQGFVVNVLNPKAGIFYVAFLPGFVDAAQPLLPQTLSLTAIYVVIATLVHGGIVTLAGAVAPLMTGKARVRVRRTLAVLLAGVAVWFAWHTGYEE